MPLSEPSATGSPAPGAHGEHLSELPSPLDSIADMRAAAKWALGAFGAVGAALLGGSPLVGVGRIHDLPHAVLAGIGLLAVVTGVGCAIWQTSKVLEPVSATPADIGTKRLKRLTAKIDQAPEEYFGIAATSVAQLLMHRRVAAQLQRAHAAETDVRRKRLLARNLQRAQANITRTDPHVKWLLAMAHAEQVQIALRRARRWTFAAMLLVIAGAVTFLVATGAPNPGRASAQPPHDHFASSSASWKISASPAAIASAS